MFRKVLKVSACIATATMVFSGFGVSAAAASLPSCGADRVISNGVDLEEYTDLQVASTMMVRQIELPATSNPKLLQEVQEEEIYKNLVIAKVHDYVNVRNTPSEEGEILGKLYDKSAGDFLKEENGWYQIKSGSVTGYVKAEYCVTGEDAIELAKQVGKRLAKVNTTTLKVRKEPDLEAGVLTLVPIEEELMVLEEADEWVKVDVEEGTGWVSKEYVDLHTEFVKAESKEEEAKRLAKEEAERKAAYEAAQAAKKNSKKSSNKNTTTYSVSGGSDMGNAVAEYALQFVGNPYVFGGSSLTEGTDCSGFVMSVYANFGVSLPHSSSSDRSEGYAVDGLENAQPGDLVCYSGHVALYIGNGQIVHASNSKTGIIVSKADYRDVLAVRRIF